jgi:3-dehydroquinate dehydratase type I
MSLTAPQYCLPLHVGNRDTVFKTINLKDSEFHLFEIWFDTIEDLSLVDLQTLATLLGPRLVLNLRRRNFEEPVRSREVQLQALDIVGKAAGYVDLDFFRQQQERTVLTQIATPPQLILSWHNYEVTPAYHELEKTAHQMLAESPAILKIATQCHTKENALDLLKLQVSLKKSGAKVIILGMGDNASITRVFGTLWGNEWLYCPVSKEEANAPSQLTRSQMKGIYDALTS